nr:aminopeptidase P family protein [Lachnospiraceae bacterium]
MGKEAIKQRLQKLKVEMKQRDIAAYIIPMNDFHGSEYIGDYFKLIRYFSGFTGSAGTLVVTEEETCLWTDGRYFVQAGVQLEGTGIVLQKMGEKNVPTIAEYVNSYLAKRSAEESKTIGFDGRLVSGSFVKKLGDHTFFCEEDPAGKIWEEDEEDKRPDFPNKPVWILKEEYAGQSAKSKLSLIRDDMKAKDADCLVLSTLDDIAWLTNLRGNDIDYNPVFLSYMIITAADAFLYCKSEDPAIRDYLESCGIDRKPYNNFYKDLSHMEAGRTVWVDDESAAYRMMRCIPAQCEKIIGKNPVLLRKAVKNETETEHMRNAHQKDAVAVTKFLYWIKEKICTGEETATELSAADKLEELRQKQEGYLGPSFSPIAAYGPHGAIVHYSADEDSDVKLENSSFLLLDTGGHYLEGTTDITRTIAMGALTPEQKKHYTAVLQGNLRLMDARFKKGLMGANLDYLAREPLYRMGLDYNHGTGHGVGYLLNVHEGPNGFRMRQEKEGVFEEGMITSDEPGVYLEGQYGIRLENLILCVKDGETQYGQFLKFEPLTLVPFDADAIDETMLTENDKKLLAAYHQRVYEALADKLDEEERRWLKTTTGVK